MLDLLIAGAGPAGSIAALVAARTGARVLLIDRDDFPRDKLCGDTLNPGAVRLLASLGLSGGALDRALALGGMRVTGPRASVQARYDVSPPALAIRRRELDAWLLEQAIAAGARFESGLRAIRVLTQDVAGRSIVRGLVLADRRAERELRVPALFTIAADGRRSALARALALVGADRSPRRWAYGVYATGVSGVTDLGEMHIRQGWYAGLAPLPDGLVNLCVVREPNGARLLPMNVIRQALEADSELGDRFAHAQLESDVRVMGPLAADVRATGVPGLLLAGDAAGFVDPMTGDGLHLAMRSAVLATEEALATLENGAYDAAADRLARRRRSLFGAKIRFNRFVRRLVASPVAIDAASIGARFFPGLIRQAVRYAGDVA